MKILITGGTGLIGSEIIKLCLEKNYEIHYLTTNKDKIKHNDKLKGFYWNPDDKIIDIKCFEGIHAIINLAGASVSKRWTASYKEEILHSRTNALDLLNETIHKLDSHTITAMATASAIGIYPNSLTNYYEESDSKTDNSFLGNVVLQWEKAADRFKAHHTISMAKIRIGLVLSGAGGALPPVSRSVKYFAGASFGNGRHWQSWVHVKDIARLFLFIIENRLKGTYNGVAPNPVTNTKFIREVAAILKRPLFLPGIPKGILKLIFGEMAYILYASQRVSAEKIQQKGFEFHFKTINTTLKDLL